MRLRAFKEDAPRTQRSPPRCTPRDLLSGSVGEHLEGHSPQAGKNRTGLSLPVVDAPTGMERLCRHPWPGRLPSATSSRRWFRAQRETLTELLDGPPGFASEHPRLAKLSDAITEAVAAELRLNCSCSTR